MPIRSMRYALAVVVACSLAAAGCGGGGDDSDTSNGSDETEQPNETTSSSRGSDSDSGTIASGFFANADCRQLARAFDQSELGSSLTSGDDPTADLQATADFLDEASDDAPAEVADDVEVLADVYADLAEQSADVDWEGIRDGNPAAAVGAAQLGQAFATPGFAEAAQNLSAFVAENCTR
jgi:hypothetical protein